VIESRRLTHAFCDCLRVAEREKDEDEGGDEGRLDQVRAANHATLLRGDADAVLGHGEAGHDVVVVGRELWGTIRQFSKIVFYPDS
jgi:hypothetical protein